MVQEQAETLITLCTEQGIPYFLASGTMELGWALVGLGQGEEAMMQIHQGLATKRTIGGAGMEETY